jgi:hypothetical protein
LIGVLRVGSEDHPDLLPQALLPRLRFLGHGFVGGSIPRDAYGSGIAAALRVAARGQILDAVLLTREGRAMADEQIERLRRVVLHVAGLEEP